MGPRRERPLPRLAPLIVRGLVPLAASLAASCAPSHGSDVLVLFGNGEFERWAVEFANEARQDGMTVERLTTSQDASSEFFVDVSKGGADKSCCLGVETGTLAFYIGHGGPEHLDSYFQGKVRLDKVQFGDGRLRYLWLVSCKTMAHGPRPFDEPHTFDPRSACDSQNVFARWGRRYPDPVDPTTVTTPLAAGLRMACGGSTRLDIPKEDTIVGLWAALASGGHPSDTFLHAFRADASETVGARTPLCITRGGEDPTATPLYDTSLVERPNEVGDGGYLYIQYPVTVDAAVDEDLGSTLSLLLTGDIDDARSVVELKVGRPPMAAPVLTLEPSPLRPQPLLEAFLRDDAEVTFGFRKLSLERVLQIVAAAGAISELDGSVTEATESLAGEARDGDVYFHPCSGALALRGRAAVSRMIVGAYEPELVPLATPTDRSFAAVDVLSGLKQIALPPHRPHRLPVSLRRVDLLIDRAPQSFADGQPSDVSIERHIKLHRIEAASALVVSSAAELDERLYSVLGEGGTANVDIGPDGSLVAAAVQARRITGCRDSECTDVPLLPLEEARQRASAEAREIQGSFQKPIETWGYLEAPSTCYQREMGIVYRFTFEPLPEEPIGVLVVDVPAQEVEPWICVGDSIQSTRVAPLPRGCERNAD